MQVFDWQRKIFSALINPIFRCEDETLRVN